MQNEATLSIGEQVSTGISRVIENIRKVIFVDPVKLEYILAAKLAGGHVILADSHGVGKTSLARALAQSFDWTSIPDTETAMDPFNRIQCTVDLLPQDILGYNRFLGDSREILFTRGPVFAHFVLCDEINLLTPKTQGSFFQVMEEGSVTVEGRTHQLGDPFFIIATMNLKGAHLFPLPAPQLDRFMIQLSMGYPSEQDEVSIITQHGRLDAWKGFSPVVPVSDFLTWKTQVDEIDIHPDVIDYLVSCIRRTRSHQAVSTGASPRSGVKLSRMARALSMIRGLTYVPLEIMKEIMVPALAHRLILKDPSESQEAVLQEILREVSVEGKRRISGAASRI